MPRVLVNKGKGIGKGKRKGDIKGKWKLVIEKEAIVFTKDRQLILHTWTREGETVRMTEHRRR